MNPNMATRGERRYLNIVFFVFGLLVLLKGVEIAIIANTEKNWDSVLDSESLDLLHEAAARFGSLQRNTRRVATDLARHPVIISSLLHPTRDPLALFDQAESVSESYDVGVEIYNAEGVLTAWYGISGPVERGEVLSALDGKLTSYVTSSALHSHLFVLIPVRSDTIVVGVVLVRNTIDVHYPLNSKLVAHQGLTDEVREDLGVSVSYGFSGENLEEHGEGYVSSILFGIDSSRIGSVSILKPTLSSYQERVRATFLGVNTLLISIVLCVAVIIAWHRLQGIPHFLFRCMAIMVLIWATRYFLLWLNIPSVYFSEGVFDPTNYASKFGGGLAKSIGELSLTSLALLINTVAFARYFARQLSSSSSHWRPKRIASRLGVGLTVTTFLLLLLRGYGAVIRSAVFDSGLMYTDPAVIIPSFELALMVVNLFTISLCLILISTGMTVFVISILSEREVSSIRPWILMAGMFITSLIILGYLEKHPFMSVAYRLAFSASILVCAGYLHKKLTEGRAFQIPGSLLALLGLSSFLLYPQLDIRIHEKDRERIEVFAAEFLRPVDSWLTFIVEEALQSFLKDEVPEIIQHGSRDDVDRLLLSLWAKSSVCREGYSSLFAVMDSAGRERNRYSIGDQSVLSEGKPTRGALASGKSVRVEQRGTGVNAVKVYRGMLPLYTGDRLLATISVVVAAGQQTLFRGEVPSFLRSPSPESLESFYRPVIVVEFRDGILFASNSDIFPVRFPIPDPVFELVRDPARSSLWSELQVGEHTYEVLYMKGSADLRQVIGLCLPVQDISWELFSVVKVLVYYSLVVLLALAGYLLFLWARGTPYRATFRDRILVALILTAVLPLVVIVYSAKDSAEQRLKEETAGRLERETSIVASRIQQQYGDAHRGSSRGITPAAIEGMAGELDTDLNFYVDASLRASSRPELYAVGLLDRRLSGGAYAAVVIRGEKFYEQTENIGRYRYAVGYRPVYSERDSLLGIVSVPTLYRQDELDRQVSQQSAFLFGVYAVVFFVILIVATTVAGTIASPVQRLTEATRRVSRGELDVTVFDARADGEIGELMHSFEAMTRDLKRQREELVRYERELAWKQMARQVAHEIKNPLTPMKLSLQHLRQTYRDRVAGFDRIIEDVTKTVIEQIDALGRIASEFSRFGRLPTADLEPCDVNVILQEALHLFEQEKGLIFDKQFGQDLPRVRADNEELRRAFINILRNGVQAMNGSGRMVIRTTSAGQEVTIAIRDFGMGVPDELKSKLFEPNFSTKTEGMGLGLAIVKKTIDDLGGKITVESSVGRGTEVTITLPANP